MEIYILIDTYAGATFSLWIFGQIMLIGLVTKNGILIVEFANQKKEKGLNVVEAVKEVARLRLRTILITSLSTILGTLPIALALGAGSESRMSMELQLLAD